MSRLEDLRRRAKDHLREQRRTDPGAKLSASQLAVAREHGFPSWPRMKAYLDRTAAAGADAMQFAYHSDPGYYEDRAYGLRASAEDGTPGAVAAFARAGAPCTPGGARMVVARAHGFPSWRALRRHVRGLPEGGEPFFRAPTAASTAHTRASRPGLRATTPQEVLDEALAYAARSGRVEVLDALVGHGARVEADVYRGTPLIWAASTGRAAAVERLLALGADPTGRGSYGGKSHGRQVTPLHLAGASGDAATVKLLLDAGAGTAVLDGHGYGTPAGWARHSGHPEIAELIEGRG